MKNVKNLIVGMVLLSTITAVPMKRQLEGADKPEGKRQCTKQQKIQPKKHICTGEQDATQLITLQLTDGTQFVIDLEIANKCATIKNMIEDLGTNSQIIPLADVVSSEALDVMISCLRNINNTATILEWLEVKELRAFILASNFLEIPELLRVAIEQYADRCTAADALEIFKANPCQHFLNNEKYLLPDEVKRAVARVIVEKYKMTPWMTSKIKIEPLVIDDFAQSFSFSPDGKMIAGAVDDGIKIWNASSGDCIKILKDHEDVISTVDWSLDGQKIVSGSDDEAVKVWNANDGSCISTLTNYGSSLRSVCFSPDGKQVALSSNNSTIQIWNIDDDSFIDIDTDYECTISTVCFSPDGTMVATGSEDGIVQIWSTSDGSFLKTLPGHEGMILAIFWSIDGEKIISSSSDGIIKVRNVHSGNCIRTFKCGDGINSISCNAERSKMVLSLHSNDDGCGSIIIINMDDGSMINFLDDLSGEGVCISVCWSPDGQKIVSAHDNSTAKRIDDDATANDMALKIWDILPITNMEKVLNNLTLDQALLLLVIKQGQEAETSLAACYDNLEIQEILQSLPEEVGHIVTNELQQEEDLPSSVEDELFAIEDTSDSGK